MTREFPPEVYGGAGVHVTELAKNLRKFAAVDVHCMGVPRETAKVYGPDPELADANQSIQMLSTQLRMANSAAASMPDVVHTHTWYTGFAGHLTSQLNKIPHVVTAHSLEPSRPWKEEQLGGGYRISSWSEKNAIENADAVIGVSSKMREEILRTYPRVDPEKVHVILNGIDTQAWQPSPTFEDAGEDSLLTKLGVRKDAPIAAFVGRTTRQKGVKHLLAAAHDFDPEIQLVLCAGAPDTPEIKAETEAAVRELQEKREGVFWAQDMLPHHQVVEVLSAASVFVCPSVYEPLGIVNLEAMACNTAVVASDVGGIPEVVVNDFTGTLVHYEESDPLSFEHDLAEAVNDIVADPEKAKAYGDAGRERAVNNFSWEEIARQTCELYESLM